MPEDKERRSQERIRIEGAEVSYRCSKDKGLFARYSEPMPVEDITWSSIRFSTKKYIKTGESVDLEMKIPGENKIRVKGHLIWSRQKPDDETLYAVVQFLPFGSGKQYNSLSIRTRLKSLITKYKSRGN